MSVDWEDLANVFAKAADIIQAPDSPNWDPLPHQKPPDLPWFVWMMMGGRGTGKTAGGAKYVHDHVHGPPCLPNVPGGHWISIVAPTLGDGVTACVNGPSGLRAWDPGVKVVNEIGGAVVKWSNGATAKMFGAHKPEDIERFRAGGNRCLVWGDEFAAWRYMDEAWQHIRYGLRVGPRPHALLTTTPRPRALIKQMMNDPLVKITHGTTADNPYLDQTVKAMLYSDYGDTRMGRQELLGEYLEDVPNALWRADNIEKHRITADAVPDFLDRVVVGVDPSLSSNATSDETGIVVAGMVHRWNRPNIACPELSHGFVFADRSLVGTPRRWAEEVVDAFNLYESDRVIAEINQGGEMVVHTIHTVSDSTPVKVITASRGKTLRAEPVAALYEQGRIHHVGRFGKLEDQMVTFDPVEPDPSWSPDRMDALVYAITDMMVGNRVVRRNRMNDKRLQARR